MTARIVLCLNCLDSSQPVRAIPVGHDKGGQRDSYRETVDLCDLCSNALVKGDFKTLVRRYQDQIIIVRKPFPIEQKGD